MYCSFVYVFSNVRGGGGGVVHFRVKDCLKNLRMTSHKGKAICWLITNVDVAASCINWLLAGCSTKRSIFPSGGVVITCWGGGGGGNPGIWGGGGTLEAWNMGRGARWKPGTWVGGGGHTGILEYR
jgi:hypothetical protein